MNIRSLTRGDGAVIGAAVLLFIASFLDYFSADCDGSFCDKIEMPNAWDTEKLQLILPTVFLTGIIGAALLIIGRFLPEGRKFGAVTLPQFGTSLLVVSLWSAVWAMIVAASLTGCQSESCDPLATSSMANRSRVNGTRISTNGSTSRSRARTSAVGAAISDT